MSMLTGELTLLFCSLFSRDQERVKRCPTDLVDRVQLPLEVKSSQL